MASMLSAVDRGISICCFSVIELIFAIFRITRGISSETKDWLAGNNNDDVWEWQVYP